MLEFLMDSDGAFRFLLLFKRASHLRFVQATAAMLWSAMALRLAAKPVIAANLLSPV